MVGRCEREGPDRKREDLRRALELRAGDIFDLPKLTAEVEVAVVVVVVVVAALAVATNKVAISAAKITVVDLIDILMYVS